MAILLMVLTTLILVNERLNVHYNATISHMSKSKQVYRPKLTEAERVELAELARDLDFFIDNPSRYYGDSSPPAMLTALAAAYAANPTAVAAALRALGIVGEGQPPARP